MSSLSDDDYGIHYMIIYHDLDTLRLFYSMYIRKEVEENNEIVLYAPFYETTESVRNTLSEGHTIIDVTRLQRSNVLAIVDSLKLYFSGKPVSNLTNAMHNHSKQIRKRGVLIMGDMGAFHYKMKKDYLVDYELSLPKRFSGNRKDLCLYHRKDFDMLSPVQKEKLDHHGMAIELQY